MSIHEIVKAKFTELDTNDDEEVDAFIIAISQTDEYENDIKNAMDFDFDDFLHGLATNDDEFVDDQLIYFKKDIRNNAVNLYKGIMEDLAEQPSTEPEDCMDIDKRAKELHRDD